MPAEKRLPRSHVAVGSGHSTDVAVDGVFEDGVESA